MSADRIDAHLPTDPAHAPESNGAASADSGALGREIVLLRARCSNLRHWCRALLDDPNSARILDGSTTSNLRDTPPEVTEPEGQTVVALLARGGELPPNHPLAPKTADTGSLRAAVAAFTAEH